MVLYSKHLLQNYRFGPLFYILKFFHTHLQVYGDGTFRPLRDPNSPGEWAVSTVVCPPDLYVCGFLVPEKTKGRLLLLLFSIVKYSRIMYDP